MAKQVNLYKAKTSICFPGWLGTLAKVGRVDPSSLDVTAQL